MGRILYIATLIVTHAAAFGLACACTLHYLGNREMQRALEDPVFQVSFLVQTQEVDSRALGSFEEALKAAGERLPDPIPKVYRLMFFLGRGQSNQAAEACRKLGWSRCDPKAIEEMQP